MIDKIIIKGAREHNLKDVNLELPRDKLIVMTGLSGCGKSSLAFDTIYADGQRRYIESLSSYARMFLGQMEKPDVDIIEGLSPAIAIDQKTTSRNPRSTVGTVTEIYDYLRLLYSKVGIPHCPVCGKEISKQSIDGIVDHIMSLPVDSKVLVLAPTAKAKKGEFVKEMDNLRKLGYVRVRIDGRIVDLSEKIKLDKNLRHDVEVVVDRLKIKEDIRSRLTDSLETASALAGGIVFVAVEDGEEMHFSQNYACPEHGVSVENIEPRAFSFNNPTGACPRCTGLGTLQRIDPELIMPNKELSIAEGGIRASGWYYAGGSVAQMYFDALAKTYNFSVREPLKNLSDEAIHALMYGTGKEKLSLNRPYEHGTLPYQAAFEGIVNNLERRYKETSSNYSRDDIAGFMSETECPDCHGERLKPEMLSVTVGNKSITKFCHMSVNEALEFVNKLALSPKDMMIAAQILKEVRARLGFLSSVGLEYLTLARAAGTLSGGESQRIRLATQIGSALSGVLYVLDEPSIGLHQRDNDKLIATLKRLRDLGNTLIVVEHDEDTMRAADYLVDIGPGPGVHGGNIVASGKFTDITKCVDSITGQYLSGKKKIPVPKKRRDGTGMFLEVIGARENNLKSIDVTIPLGTFTCVTGVSGSGKSSLVNEIIFKYLSGTLNRSRVRAGAFDEMRGVSFLDKVIDIDQSPIGRTPRSNPATYTGVFTDIRDLYSHTNDAKMRGYGTGRFSFNIKGGRCEDCEGDGIIKIEMHFLPDVYVQCDTCKGKRYNRETLEVKYKGKSIYDVLDMTVEEAVKFFDSVPKIARKLQTLYDVGLGYIKVGQSATTLSGGEAQRVKLATELSKRATGKTIYILDEPTTGLHTADVQKLLEVLDKLANDGNTVLVIEHNLDVIKSADYIIDLGPEGGDKGGTVIAEGTPEELAENPSSYTGQYLKRVLK
ncbi:MAG: excinuclease ABC subunit UvrA [Oscillospiraceae bacterium]|jgi:excinuclease ABC subunit A|nr:excinuclease ABC subunit UvrA [Oscillospiraceae bacterium]